MSEITCFALESIKLILRIELDESLTHGVASIPLFSLDRWAPSVLGELRKLLFPVGNCFFVNFGVSQVGTLHTASSSNIEVSQQVHCNENVIYGF